MRYHKIMKILPCAALFLLCPAAMALPAAELPAAPSLNAAFETLSALAHQAAADQAGIVRRARYVPHPMPLPDYCPALPVVAIRDGELFKNGVSIGRDPSDYQAGCDGTVAWRDSYGGLYRETSKIADNISRFDLSWYGGVIAWTDSYGELHRGGDSFGRAENYVFVKYTGDVVWKDGWGDVYRNREKLGRAENYAAAARTGDVAWIDSFGTLHRNSQELGRAESWQISDRTGDVGWLDSFHNLYKNGARVGTDVTQFYYREDGRLIWTDSWGVTHSA